MNLSPKPKVRVPLRCRLGFHRPVSLEHIRQAMSPMIRRFSVREVKGCTRCGIVQCVRFTNGVMGHGGTVTSGYADPKDIASSPSTSSESSAFQG